MNKVDDQRRESVARCNGVAWIYKRRVLTSRNFYMKPARRSQTPRRGLTWTLRGERMFPRVGQP